MKRVTAWLVGGAFALPAGDAAAHAFGGRYDLPLPLYIFQLAAGLAVLLSFVGLAAFTRPQDPNRHVSGGLRIGELRQLPAWTSTASALLYLGVIVAALAGSNGVMDNIAPTFIWIWFWVGVAFASALVGDIWTLLSPFPAFGRLVAAAPRWPLPESVGRWPAFASFLVFAWLELVSGFGEKPHSLGIIMLIYLGWMLAGMWCFGMRQWLQAADVFENVFGLLACFGPLRISRPPERGVASVTSVRLQWLGAGLRVGKPVHVSQTALVLALLATVSFDGIIETPAWLAIRDWIENSPTWRPLLLAVHGFGINLLLFVKTLALLFAPVVFGFAYAVCIGMMRLLGGSDVGFMRLFNGYALSLVPIAVAYHLAHYLSYLATAGQQLIPLLSDPLGRGWNLFGTADYSIEVGVIGPKAVWIFAAMAIVTGHVISVVLAHWQASRDYTSRKRVISSQLPMVILMVAYTMTSLWILSQPIVE